MEVVELTEIGTAVTQAITWIGNVVTALLGESGAWAPLWPYFVIGIGISIVSFGAIMISRLVWGR